MRAPRADLYGFDGQSLVTTPDEASAYPAKFMAWHPGDVGRVVARGGTSWPDRTAAPSSRVDRLLGMVTGRRIYVDCGGTFDLNLGFSAASILANAEANWSARRAAGWTTVVATTIPHSTGFDATEEARRLQVNAGILASAALDVAVDLSAIEVDGVAVLEDATLLDYWAPDGLHWLGTATDLVARALEETLIG